MNDFDIMLWRPVQDGKQFENLMPQSSCNRVGSGSGNTDFSIQEMKAVIIDHNSQTEKIAKVLAQSSLKGSVIAIKDFAYNHFQYKADGEDQLLRSPACSWYDRHNGIDCKSYSIIASCLLTNMNIVHYIRKIKQPGYAPTEWTHVYVIVPIDQETGDLQKGHYCIDGTLQEDTEPRFIEKSDLYMEHFRLNGAHNQALNGISIKDVTSFISSLSCIGNSAYDRATLKADIAKITPFFDEMIASMNANIAAKNLAAFSEDAADFIGYSTLLLASYEKKLSEGWASCTTTNLKATIKLLKFYRDNVGGTLKAYLDTYFVKGTSTNTALNSSILDNMQFWGNYVRPEATVSVTTYNYTAKPVEIPKFEITPYVLDTLASGTPVDPIQFIQGLMTIAGSFGSNTNTGSGPYSPNTGTGTTQDYNGSVTQKQAGFGVVGWVFVLLAGGYAINKFSGKKETSKK